MLLEEIYEGAPTVFSGKFRTSVNELTDQRPALRPEVLAEAVTRLVSMGTFTTATKLVTEEDKGGILAGPVCLAAGLPLAVARWYPYDLPDEGGRPAAEVELTSEYFSGHLYLNGVVPGDRVVIIDDTVSTGGTLMALIEAVRQAGAEVLEVLVVTEKPANGGVAAVRERCGVPVKAVLQVGVDAASGLVRVLPTPQKEAEPEPAPAPVVTVPRPAWPLDSPPREPRDMIAAIGGTELCRLRRVVPAGAARVYAKCEFRNPTGSHKDRIFNYMIDALELRGAIEPGWTLVECSTGNGGAALAQVGLARGYRVVILMPAGMTIERKTQIGAFGAEIIETDPAGFLLQAEDEARAYVRRHPRSYFLDQSTNPLNWQAWRKAGEEIAADFRRLGRPVDRFVCSIGTGGTFSGIADALKAEFPDLVTVAVEVDVSAALLAKRTHQPFQHQPHNLMGLGPGKIPGNAREELIDEVRTVSSDQAWSMMKRLIAEEKLFTGPTAGANAFVAAQVAAELPADQSIVTVLFDSAWKYVSVWDGDYSRSAQGREFNLRR
ncbi:MAG TPA: pyridoxal-phosphate dependent enzyme [Streptosporangiaceae bacterium]|jgi:cysteine synthase A